MLNIIKVTAKMIMTVKYPKDYGMKRNGGQRRMRIGSCGKEKEETKDQESMQWPKEKQKEKANFIGQEQKEKEEKDGR